MLTTMKDIMKLKLEKGFGFTLSMLNRIRSEANPIIHWSVSCTPFPLFFMTRLFGPICHSSTRMQRNCEKCRSRLNCARLSLVSDSLWALSCTFFQRIFPFAVGIISLIIRISFGVSFHIFTMWILFLIIYQSSDGMSAQQAFNKNRAFQ